MYWKGQLDYMYELAWQARYMTLWSHQLSQR